MDTTQPQTLRTVKIHGHARALVHLTDVPESAGDTAAVAICASKKTGVGSYILFPYTWGPATCAKCIRAAAKIA